jgi:poly(hydroxyalkanoate) granule-associated protein
MSVTKAKQTAAALLRDAWLVGLGAVAVTGEGVAAATRALKKKGEEFESRAPRLKAAGEAPGKAARKLGEKLGAGAARVRKTAESGVRSVIQTAGIPVREEIEALRRKVDELTARLSEVQARKAVPAGQA